MAQESPKPVGELAHDHTTSNPDVTAAKRAADEALEEGEVCKRRRTSDAAEVVAQSISPNSIRGIQLSVAVSEDPGARSTYEDVHVVELDARLGDDQNAPATKSPRICFMAIFDGHGGRSCAEFAAAHLHETVMRAGLQEAANACCSASSPAKLNVKAAKAAITEGFRAADEALLKECASKGWQDGACAVAIWVVQDTVLVANVGDAKAVLARVSDKADSKGHLKALTLTKDHLAIHATERARIEKAGGFVSKDGRLNGRMQVARSFGDAQLKKSGCSPLPDISAFELTGRDHFLVAACDGFWGVFDGQGAVDMASSLLSEGRDNKSTTNRLLNEAIRVRGCKDNCTVMLVKFSKQQSEAKLEGAKA